MKIKINNNNISLYDRLKKNLSQMQYSDAIFRLMNMAHPIPELEIDNSPLRGKKYIVEKISNKNNIDFLHYYFLKYKSIIKTLYRNFDGMIEVYNGIIFDFDKKRIPSNSSSYLNPFYYIIFSKNDKKITLYREKNNNKVDFRINGEPIDIDLLKNIQNNEIVLTSIEFPLSFKYEVDKDKTTILIYNKSGKSLGEATFFYTLGDNIIDNIFSINSGILNIYINIYKYKKIKKHKISMDFLDFSNKEKPFKYLEDTINNSIKSVIKQKITK